MARNRTSKGWMQEHVSDPYVRQAKQQGYRSRAAFKLLEILQKDRLLRPGMLVVDLGAAPGGWSQVTAPLVAPAGRVIALDLLEMAPIPGVEFIRGDFREDAVLAEVTRLLDGRAADLVLSDMSPNISGIGVTDQSRSMHLAELALEFSVAHLKPGGSLLVKVFQGAGTEALRLAFGEIFDSVVVRKPRASRDRSSEFYLLGRGRKSAS
ncbi:MAG: RlmE family RNA methyltransferase [Burkholderiales bacterium]